MYYLTMGKKKKSSSEKSGTRVRVNPLTGETETTNGPRSGKGKVHLPVGHPLRTHDLHPVGYRKKKHDNMMNKEKNQES